MFYAEEYSLSSDSDDDCSESEDETASIDEYIGYKPPPGVTDLTDRIAADISPEEFFIEYIAARRPAVFSGLLKDSAWKGHRWTNTYLRKVAGDAKILVEDRKDMASNNVLSFGFYAPKIEMKYSEVVDAIMVGETRYYITTQDVERFTDDYDEFGLPKAVLAEPLRHLAGDFPMQPSLLGNLVPHLVSLWQGSTTRSTSTGLHHDFHDNLYLLLRGKKRFRLFPPSDAPLLRLTGRPTKIHRNGLIVYPLPRAVSPRVVAVRPDGAPLAVLAQQKCDIAERDLLIAEQQLLAAQSGADKTSTGNAQRHVNECEERLDQALQELLRYQSTDEDESNAESAAETDDDEPTAKQPKLDISTDSSFDVPQHFCNVALPDVTDHRSLLTAFGVDTETESANMSCLVVELKANEMLYLPASWFHEVTSYNSPAAAAAAAGESEELAGHLALNYWMYPPDNNSFQQPYNDSFWPQRWTNISTSANH